MIVTKRDPKYTIAIDRLGELVDRMHDTARAQKNNKHGDYKATRAAADLISDFRKRLQRK